MFARSKFKPAVLAVLLATVGFSAHADLARVGPTNNPAPPGNGFPLWYQDLGGTVLDFCLPDATDPLNAAGVNQQSACLLAGIGINPPYTFPTNFPGEVFFFRAVSPPIATSGTKRATVVLALEGSFLSGAPVANQQMVFTRIRVTAGVPEFGTYTVTHPYGVEVFPDVSPAPAGNRDIFFTDDVGLTPLAFSDALHSRVGPFLQRTDQLGTPLGPVTINGAQFLSDGVTPEFVTGSPFNTNYVMICGTRPDGTEIVMGNFGPGGPGTGNCAGDATFSLTGRLHNLVASPIGTPLAIKAATYGRDANGTYVDTFAAVVKALPTQPNPVLSAAALNQVPVKMSGPDVLGDYYSQSIVNPSGDLPGSVTVINSADNPPSTATANVVDAIYIESAAYDPVSQTLTVVATSSDKGFGTQAPPAMTLEGFPTTVSTPGGIVGDPAAVTLTVTPVALKPASVRVLSSGGGLGSSDVAVTPAPAFAPGVVFAQDDTFSAVASGAAVTVPVLANDIVNAAAPFNPATVAIVAPGLTPNIGGLTVDAAGNVTFTPTATAGVATFKYTVANVVGTSNPATVTVNVAPPAGGPVPIANADPGPNTVVTNGSLTINVLANDSGNGGTLDPASVQVVPASVTGGTATADPATGTVTYTAAGTAGTFGFDYTVANLVTGNRSLPAHVTVTITNPEVIAVATGSSCKRASATTGDWKVRGTSTVSTGNSITLYTTAAVPASPTAAQTVTTVPVVTGAWQVNVRGGAACPLAAPGNTLVSVQSTLGTKVNNIPLQVQ
ncbi:MAG: hypothetical protein H6R11_190 [Proteobacteria bacterium]|nr:hypothetical protein [Pseudomonadota bacterium]